MQRFSGSNELPAELGARLRELRVRAGLTQQQVMERAGRTGKGLASLASRLESGRVRQVSVGLVADYLRACRAQFSELDNILDRYTGQRPVVDEQVRTELLTQLAEAPREVRTSVLRYDTKQTLWRRESAAEGKAPKPVPVSEEARKRVQRALKLARALTIDRIVRRAVEPVLEAYAGSLSVGELRTLANFGRRILKALVRNQGNKRRPRRARRRQLHSAVERVQELLGDMPVIDDIGLMVFEVHNRLSELGKLERFFRLDYEERVLRRLEESKEAEERRWSKRQGLRREEELNRWAECSVATARLAFTGELIPNERNREVIGRANRFALPLIQVIQTTGTGSKERERRLGRLAEQWGDRVRFRVAAGKAEKTYEYWQKRKPGECKQSDQAPPQPATGEGPGKVRKPQAGHLLIFLDAVASGELSGSAV